VVGMSPEVLIVLLPQIGKIFMNTIDNYRDNYDRLSSAQIQ
jgi:hypothetical protein